MKIKCINTAMDFPNPTIINNDVRGHVNVGSVFWVYGLNFSKGITYCYIFNGEHLFEVPLNLFEIIDGKIPDSWSIRIQENGDVTLWPSLFYRNQFLENFAEREAIERREFNVLQSEIEV